MIDYFMKFTDEASAIADATLSTYYANNRWNPSSIIPAMFFWRPSQDVAGAHTYLLGWCCCLSLDRIDATLMSHAALLIAADRDLAASGQDAILRSNVDAVIQDLRFQPVYAGSNYPFGSFVIDVVDEAGQQIMDEQNLAITE